jgi:hypothetical protein
MMLCRSAVVLGILLFIACGGATAPTPAPTPPPIPTATLVGEGGGQWSLCAGPPFSVCTFQAAVKNTGPGCAVNIRGVVKFFDAAGAQLSTAYNWTAPPAVSVLRPGESFSYLIPLVPSALSVTAATFRTEAAWDPTRC